MALPVAVYEMKAADFGPAGRKGKINFDTYRFGGDGAKIDSVNRSK